PPFDASNIGEMIAAHLCTPPPRASTYVGETPPEVDELILRCLAKDPSERYANGAEVAAALEQLGKRVSLSPIPRSPVSPLAHTVAPAPATIPPTMAPVAPTVPPTMTPLQAARIAPTVYTANAVPARGSDVIPTVTPPPMYAPQSQLPTDTTL